MRYSALVICVMLGSACASQGGYVVSDDIRALSKDEKAAQLVQLLMQDSLDMMVDDAMGKVMTSIMPQRLDGGASMEEEARIKELSQKVPVWTAEFLQRDESRGFFLKAATQGYRDGFKESELEELLVFYRSPLGTKLLKKSPKLLNKMSHSIAKALPQFEEQLRIFIEEKRTEITGL